MAQGVNSLGAGRPEIMRTWGSVWSCAARFSCSFLGRLARHFENRIHRAGAIAVEIKGCIFVPCVLAGVGDSDASRREEGTIQIFGTQLDARQCAMVPNAHDFEPEPSDSAASMRVSRSGVIS
jgi:hypothetical protein